MAELTGEEYFPEDTYHGAWTIFWLLTIGTGILIWLSFFRPLPVTAPPQAAISAGYDWFLVLHLPEVPRDPAKAAAAQKSFAGWMDALSTEGYHPMLLSDVERRIKLGQGLPNRAVVLTFDPAYSHTYDVLGPMLVQYRFPAFWVTDHTALLRGDRHYIHRHQATWMVQSGYWDLGYTGDGFWRKATDGNEITIDSTHSASWVPGTGRTALNWGTDLPRLNRLDVSPKWTPEDLISRLEMELPLEGTVYLGVRRLQNRWWGVVMTTPQKNSVFTFQAPLGNTSSNLYWFGTRNVPDVQLDMDIASFFGEVSLWMRSDYKKGDGVGVGFTQRQLFVDQQSQGSRHRLAEVPWTPPAGALKGRIILEGSQLQVLMQGAKPLNITLRQETPSPQGLVRLQVFDRVRGAAQAKSVNLVLTSLKKSQKP